MPKKPKPAPKKLGRPQKIPAGAKPRTIRMTPDERKEVVALLLKLRGENAVNRGGS